MPGSILIIGGSEQKDGQAAVLRRFVSLCGGAAGRIGVLPTASELDDTGAFYVEVFRTLGIGHALELDPADPSPLRLCDGAFLTGGDQEKLADAVMDTPFATELRRLHRLGLHLAGTSAGAAFLSDPMIVCGSGPQCAIDRGLGVISWGVVDQHFAQRGRLRRLAAVVRGIPVLYGIGVDEDTAAILSPGGTLEVVGSGHVTMVSPDASVRRLAPGEVIPVPSVTAASGRAPLS